MVSRVSKLVLAGVAVAALSGASMTGAAFARDGHGGPGGGGGPGHSMGGGGPGPGMSSGGFGARSGPAQSFGGRETVGVAPNAHTNMAGPNNGRTFNRGYQGRTINGNGRYAGNWNGDRWNGDRGHGDRDHRHFRGGFFGFGYGPYYDDDYGYGAYSYNDCYYGDGYRDWRWRQYCGPYANGYGPTAYGYDYGW